MAARDTTRCSFLNDDRKMYDLSETINAPQHYKVLGLDLVESTVELSSIIGQTSTDYQDVVFSCIIDWRNDKGVGDEQCRKLVRILRDCQLTDVASWLEKKQGDNSRCLGIDRVLQDLSQKIDCPKYYQKLGIKLVDSKTLSNKIGTNRPPNYKDALFQCFIKFRDTEGSSMDSARKLRKILVKRKLKTSVAKLDEWEPGLHDTDGTGDCCENMETGEPEAGIYCRKRVAPEGSS